MSRQLDLKRLTPIQRGYVVGFKRAYHRAGIEYRQELAVLRDFHQEEMTKLAHFYDKELKNLAADFALLAAAHREELRRRAVSEALVERSASPGMLLH